MYFKEFLVGGEGLSDLGEIILEPLDGGSLGRFLGLKVAERRGLVEA